MTASCVCERERDHFELAKMILTASRDLVHMLGKTKFLVKGNTQLTNREIKRYLREDLRKLVQISTLKLPNCQLATQPN